MSDSVYSRDILRLATRLAAYPPLAAPLGVGEARATPCGSRMTLTLALQDGQVTEAGAQVQACALGQASAAVLLAGLPGLGSEDVAARRERFRDYLQGEGEADGEFELFRAARPLTARHGAILLPYDAALAALEDALSRSRNALTSAA